jgi:hypothetical protein
MWSKVFIKTDVNIMKCVMLRAYFLAVCCWQFPTLLTATTHSDILLLRHFCTHLWKGTGMASIVSGGSHGLLCVCKVEEPGESWAGPQKHHQPVTRCHLL